ncbi:MAG: DUF2061 domain-containing protein [Halobacteriota archaeon]|uniref:DUF2061 domain-containing protein n=1 Tax=Halodesulfurarchaeum sp. HSR-GB TaxID=3074077 RepID=UPI002854C0C5|nr:DUF2061 domain-containing protein [Halodesulfurarchaeum sp. HSR-GB]MDR5657328.1 DUF2061 domain-containing protein [Halodesulfurarchaeum sp. HSR-GB]
MGEGSWLPDVEYNGPQHRWWESLAKALVYRFFMIVLTILVAYAVTTDTTASLQIGVVTNVIKTGTYYAYERLWDRFRFGGLIDG